MKKVFSVLMAVAMLAALMVPAFAATLTQDQNTGGATVKTDTSAAGEGTYTVTYAAEISVPWNSTAAVSSEYTVETHLKTGKQLQVTAKSDGMMTYESEELAYTLGGDKTYTAGAAETATKAITVQVAQDAWDKAPIAEYTDTITYTAEIV